MIQLHPEQDDAAPITADVDIVIPVYNEADQLAASVTRLRTYLDTSFPFSATITIADNASTDDSWAIATGLAGTLPGVEAIHLTQKGRGRALRTAWLQSRATVVAYMDVDLATELGALLPLVAPLLSGHSDLAIGSRLATGAHVVRGTQREFISRGYNLLLRATLRSATTDAQCGFKGMRRAVAIELLPLVEDNEWFFDTELLVTAQRIGFRIHEVPVDWVDDTDSRVDIVHTALGDLRGVVRMLGPSARQRAVVRPARAADPVPEPGGGGTGDAADAAGVAASTDLGATSSTGAGTATGRPSLRWAGEPHRAEWAPLSLTSDPFPRLVTESRSGGTQPVFADELLRFAGVGAISTAACAGLFAVLEPGVGCYWANAVAIGLCSLGNTAAHRGLADTARLDLDRPHRYLTAGALLGVSLTVSTAALAATRAVGLRSLGPELCAVVVANLGAAVIRFDILRSWVFRPEYGTHLSSSHASGGAGEPRTAAATRAPR